MCSGASSATASIEEYARSDFFMYDLTEEV
jgi:hypothetical protein